MSLLNLLLGSTPSKTFWHGYYVQHHKEHRFKAELVHDDNKFHGNIIDIDFVNSKVPIDDYLERSSLSSFEKQDFKQKTEYNLKCSEGELVYITEELAERSTIRGDITDNFISFIKTYEIGAVTTCFTDRFQIRYQGVSLPILYEGILSEDSSQITGRWFLHDREASTLLEGPFVMNRL